MTAPNAQTPSSGLADVIKRLTHTDIADSVATSLPAAIRAIQQRRAELAETLTALREAQEADGRGCRR